VASCPKAEALKIETSAGKVVTPLALVGLTIAIMVGVIAVSVVAGGMNFFTKPLVQQAGAVQGAVTGAPETAGASAFDVALIKGYMTMNEVSEATGIPTGLFVSTFGVTQDELSMPLKQMKDVHGFDTQAVREFVAVQMGVECSPAEGCE
jgi:ABC-type lipoprotein release transport system permease subunit